MKKFAALCSIIALITTLAGCTPYRNRVIYIYGRPDIPVDGGEVFFYNMEGQNVQIVGDPGDNDFSLRRLEMTLSPGTWGGASPNPGPHTFTVKRLLASQGFQKIYEVPVDVSQSSCHAYLIYFNGSEPVSCP